MIIKVSYKEYNRMKEISLVLFNMSRLTRQRGPLHWHALPQISKILKQSCRNRHFMHIALNNYLCDLKFVIISH